MSGRRRTQTIQPTGQKEWPLSLKLDMILTMNAATGKRPEHGRELAYACNVSQPTASRWIRGVRVPRQAELVTLGRVLGLRPEYLADPSKPFPPTEEDYYVPDVLADLPLVARRFWTPVLTNPRKEREARRILSDALGLDQEP